MTPNSLEATIDVDFWSKADVQGVDECWEWKGRVHKGRPSYMCAGSPVAARTAYALYYERHPGKMLVLHSCDNGMCVNPGHLFLGTTADNIADKVAKGRQAKGTMFGRSKLTDETASELLRRYCEGDRPSLLMSEYGICSGSFYQMITRETWKHISCDEKALEKAREKNRRLGQGARGAWL